MVFPWSKNERTEPDPADASDRPESPSEIGQLIAALGHVGQLVATANEKILAGLSSREPPGGAGASSADASTARLEAIEE